MKKNNMIEFLLCIFKTIILVIIYNFLIGTSIMNIFSSTPYYIFTFLLIFFLYSQLYSSDMIPKNKLTRFVIYPILLLIVTLILVPLPKLLYKQKINNEYAPLEKEINDFIKKTDEFIKYDNGINSMEEYELSIIDNHTVDTIFIDYDNKEIAIWSGIYVFESYILSKNDDCITPIDEYYKDKEYKIQYKKSLNSPGKQLITYYYSGPDNTHKIELIMSDGVHYYGCPSNRFNSTSLNHAIDNEK